MKTALRGCGCVPFIVGYGAIYHASACRKSPNVRLGINEAEVWRAQNRAASKAAERHPASGTQRPLRIVEDVEYMDHHSDDLDDDGEAL
jgi:hypothetical protein